VNRADPTVREEAVEQAILQRFIELRLNDEERRYIASELRKLKAEDAQHLEETMAALKLRLSQIEDSQALPTIDGRGATDGPGDFQELPQSALADC